MNRLEYLMGRAEVLPKIDSELFCMIRSLITIYSERASKIEDNKDYLDALEGIIILAEDYLVKEAQDAEFHG